jgi:hypothetical protein
MSFWTTLFYARPGRAPRVSSAQLADFVERFERSSRPVVDHASCQVMWGDRVDRDMRPLEEEEETYRVKGAIITRSVERDLDINIFENAGTLEPVIGALRAEDKPVYRAYISLGNLVDAKGHALTYEPQRPGETLLWVGAAGLQVGPVAVGALDGDEVTMVSWLALEVGGQGQLWPRTGVQVREDLERLPAVQSAMALCREVWPADPVSVSRTPTRGLANARKLLGRLWPYDRVNTPADWAWYVSESG